MNPWRVCQLEFGLEYFCHPTWTSPSLLRCLKLRKKSPSLSKNCVPITLDNPQTSLSTLSIWTTFYWRNSLSENGWQSVLWLIQSSWGTVSGKRYFIEIFKAIFLLLLFFVFLQAPQTKFHLLPLYLGKGRNPRGRYLSLTTWANKIQIFCLAELIQIGLCVDLSIKFKWFLKRP